MTPEEQKERIRLYEKTREELVKSQLSNSENFDRAILTLSSAAIGLTVTFLGNVVKIQEASSLFLLIISWVLFGAAIVSTMMSYVNGQAGIKLQLKIAEKYYLKEEDDAINERNKYADSVEKLNWFSGIFFIAAITSLVLFVTINIITGSGKVNIKQKDKPSITDTTSKKAAGVFLKDARTEFFIK